MSEALEAQKPMVEATCNQVLSDMDDLQCRLDVTLIKAKVLADEIMQGYFDKRDPEPWMLALEYERYTIFSSVLFDYLHEAGKTMNELSKQIESFRFHKNL